MDPRHRIYLALDGPALEPLESLLCAVAPAIGGIKVGLELLNAEGAPQVIARLQRHNLPIFFDGKFHDIPNTVAGAVRAIAGLGLSILNLHALGGSEMMRAGVCAAKEGAQRGNVPCPKVLAVTILTSHTPAGLRDIGMEDIADANTLTERVVALAQLAQAAGCDGVVASPHEIAAIRAACGPEFLIVTPGVRPVWAARDDQARVMTPREAVHAGADFCVIGRPITNPPPSVGSPADAAQKIVEELGSDE